MTASDDLPIGANSLLPKLQTKLVVSPGMINTQQLHRHYTSHNATANRLLQRLAIPEQLTGRYTAGVLQPEAMRSRSQRFQRTESSGGSESLVNMSRWQQNEGGSHFFSQHGESTVPMPPQPSYTTGSSAHSASATVVSLPQASPNAIADSTTTVTANPHLTLNPSQSLGSSIQAKMQPQADNYSKVNVVNNTHISATIQQKYGQPEGLQSANDSTSKLLYRVLRKTVENFTPPVLSAATGAEALEVSSNSTSDSNLLSNQASLNSGSKVANTTQASGVTIQRKYHKSELLLRPNQDARGVLVRAAENEVYKHTKINSENTGVIARVASSEVTVPRLIQPKPLPLLIQRQVTEKLVQNQGNFLIQNRTDLPLAISPSHNSAHLSRQTTTVPAESATSETINAIPTPTAPTSPSPLNTGVDVAEIAEQVSRIILRRLVVERERGGMGR